ncbi:MAG: hypothetical protein JO352_35440, partial [Chloroflexi bacterium]|nr:hypothetical protein [Chloroflexota bacterium]
IAANPATRDELIIDNLMGANSEERHLLRDNKNFQALLKDLPADLQKRIKAILRAP